MRCEVIPRHKTLKQKRGITCKAATKRSRKELLFRHQSLPCPSAYKGATSLRVACCASWRLPPKPFPASSTVSGSSVGDVSGTYIGGNVDGISVIVHDNLFPSIAGQRKTLHPRFNLSTGTLQIQADIVLEGSLLLQSSCRPYLNLLLDVGESIGIESGSSLLLWVPIVKQ